MNKIVLRKQSVCVCEVPQGLKGLQCNCEGQSSDPRNPHKCQLIMEDQLQYTSEGGDRNPQSTLAGETSCPSKLWV